MCDGFEGEFHYDYALTRGSSVDIFLCGGAEA
jgi:hypothetical protein